MSGWRDHELMAAKAYVQQNPMKRLLSADENGSPSLKAVAYIEETHHSDLTNNNNENN